MSVMDRVLVVDDEKSIRVTLCEFLSREGYLADNAADAFAAVRMLEAGEYDVIVSDIIMPRVSGIELLELVREKSRSVQYIIMTGEPSVETAIKAVQNGASDFLVKPIDREAFLKAVRSCVRIKTLIDQKTALEQANLAYQKDLEERIGQRTRELQNAMQSIVSLLSSVVEARDPYTAGHQRRVGNLSAAIAGKMGLDARSADLLRIIGYIHDIGKITVPTEILSKPGKINPFEMRLIQNHPEAGYEMLVKVELPDIIARTVHQHHERCDGSGYPCALRADGILREAKILMVADVVEAMMFHRPYRASLGQEAALCEVRSNAGRLYSRDVVEACISLFTEDRYEFEDREYRSAIPLRGPSATGEGD